MVGSILAIRSSEPSLAGSIYTTNCAFAAETTVSMFLNGNRASAAGMLGCSNPAVLLSRRLFIRREHDDLNGLALDGSCSDAVSLDGVHGRTVTTIAAHLLSEEAGFRANLFKHSSHLRERDDFGAMPEMMADYRRVVASLFCALPAEPIGP